MNAPEDNPADEQQQEKPPETTSAEAATDVPNDDAEKTEDEA